MGREPTDLDPESLRTPWPTSDAETSRHADQKVTASPDLRKSTPKCSDARKEKDIIENLMLIPLIQGTLRYGWKTENEAYSEKAEAEGTIFALAVTPVLAACDPAAAEVVASNLVAGQAGTADFAAVKAAFEANYECMGVDGAMVGGLYDSATDEYYLGAEPASAGAATSMAIGAAFAAVTSLAMFL